MKLGSMMYQGVVVVLVLVLHSAKGEAECAIFKPVSCLYGDVEISKKHCHPSPCNFDLKMVRCGLILSDAF